MQQQPHPFCTVQMKNAVNEIDVFRSRHFFIMQSAFC